MWLILISVVVKLLYGYLKVLALKLSGYAKILRRLKVDIFKWILKWVPTDSCPDLDYIPQFSLSFAAIVLDFIHGTK